MAPPMLRRRVDGVAQSTACWHRCSKKSHSRRQGGSREAACRGLSQNRRLPGKQIDMGRKPGDRRCAAEPALKANQRSAKMKSSSPQRARGNGAGRCRLQRSCVVPALRGLTLEPSCSSSASVSRNPRRGQYGPKRIWRRPHRAGVRPPPGLSPLHWHGLSLRLEI